jgi:hypothetical protein
VIAAQRVTKGFIMFTKHIEAVMLTGSTSRGYADKFSDIELGIVWYCPPSESERLEMIQRIGGNVLSVGSFNEYSRTAVDEFLWNSYRFDVKNMTTKTVCDYILEVVAYPVITLYTC